MRKIREILRLALGEGLSRRTTAAATGVPYTTVSDHLVRAARAGLGWPLPDGMDDAQLEARLFARAEPPPSASRPLPDWPTVHRELRRKGVTLQLLWAEYVAAHGERSYRYSQYCNRYRQWRDRQKRSMRQVHLAGEKLFIDYCGPTVPIVDGWTLLGAMAVETHRVHIGLNVTGNLYRHPALLAKIAVTVDQLSGGRLAMGIGAGWNEPEFRMFGMDFPERPGERIDRLEEAGRVLTSLGTQPVSTFTGR